MYNLSYFKENDPSVVLRFIREHSFAMLCGTDQQGCPVATQLPLLIQHNQEKLMLRGHLMKKTDHHKAFEQNPNILVLFKGPHTYVSASWYHDQQQASTWNYISVQVKGKLRFIDESHLPQILNETTDLYENNADSPSSFTKLPPEYISRLSKAIVAFEIEVTDVQNVFKLSQNHDKESFENIIRQLKKGDSGARDIATEMELRHSQLFNGSDH